MTQSIKFWLNLSKIRNKIQTTIKKINPDIVLFMNFPATLWAQKFGNTPVLCYPSDINLLYTNTYITNLSKTKYISWLFWRQFVRIIDKKRWSVFDEIICHSNFSSKNIAAKYNVNPRVVLLGTRTNIFRPTTSEKKKVVLSIAAQKAQRVDFLIRSLKNILKNSNEEELWIVGSTEENDNQLKKLVNDLGLTDKVKFFGRVTDEELIDLYSQASVVVHLVRQPPFGLIVTESMSCGTPVIACHPGGTDETIVHGETGFLIGDEDTGNLIKYTKKLLDNPELSVEMGKNARKRVQELFELDSNNKKIREIMEEWVLKKQN